MIHLGLGVMINMLGGNESTINAISSCLGKIITSTELKDDQLLFTFNDLTVLRIWDGGQSCCEHRYMTCDDDLEYFDGAELLDVGLRSADSPVTEYCEEHDIQFLDVKTSKGLIQACTHNEHNGYYGGFWIQAALD